MTILFLLVVLATSVWVYFDASQIGVKKGMAPGMFDMTPGMWAAGVLLLWILFFPAYIAKRGEFERLAQSGSIAPDSGPDNTAIFVYGGLGLLVLALVIYTIIVFTNQA